MIIMKLPTKGGQQGDTEQNDVANVDLGCSKNNSETATLIFTLSKEKTKTPFIVAVSLA
jgi:hypothetical protein